MSFRHQVYTVKHVRSRIVPSNRHKRIGSFLTLYLTTEGDPAAEICNSHIPQTREAVQHNNIIQTSSTLREIVM
jgi:hypothetical protein